MKAVSGIVLTVLLAGVLTLAFNFKPVKASGTIYINADGSIDPPMAPISSNDNVTYHFTDNIYDEIGVLRSNIIVDGNGYTLQGSEGINGLMLLEVNNVTIKNTNIEGFISNATFTGVGILSFESYNINISGNNVTKNTFGIMLYYHVGDLTSCTITGNNIVNNYCGVGIAHGGTDRIYHNNFVNNTDDTAWQGPLPNNVWDDGYPSGGNYWSDYNGTDANQDGIGDTPLFITTNNIDHYPLMGMFSDFKATSEYHVQTICNSTISAFKFDQVDETIRFNVTGEEGIGFCRVCIPHDLMEPSYLVTVDGYPPQYVNYTLYDNSTHRWTYFNYQHSTHEVIIAQPPVGGVWVPVDNFALLAPYIALASTILVATAATAIYVKRRKKRQ